MTIPNFETKVEYPILTKATGSLDYTSLKIIKDELKANAASIDSILGGGMHRHLGLVMNPTEYALVSATPYVRHPLPNVPVIAAARTQHEATRLREEYKDDLKLFQEIVALEKYLMKLLSHAVPAIFLKPFRSRNSNAITQDIPTILTTLFNDHGQVPEEELLTEENNLRAKVFDIAQPIIVLYNEVEDLQELALASNKEEEERNKLCFTK